jgi:plastocyanin
MALARLAAALLLVLSVAGCGGDDPPERPRDGRVTITLDDFSISPQELRAAPGRITVTATNGGRLPHNFRLRRGAREPLKITTLLPGATGTASVTLRRGEYDMVCTVGNHEELGMRGTLIVR